MDSLDDIDPRLLVDPICEELSIEDRSLVEKLLAIAASLWSGEDLIGRLMSALVDDPTGISFMDECLHQCFGADEDNDDTSNAGDPSTAPALKTGDTEVNGFIYTSQDIDYMRDTNAKILDMDNNVIDTPEKVHALLKTFRFYEDPKTKSALASTQFKSPREW